MVETVRVLGRRAVPRWFSVHPHCQGETTEDIDGQLDVAVVGDQLGDAGFTELFGEGRLLPWLVVQLCGRLVLLGVCRRALAILRRRRASQQGFARAW